MPRRHGKEARVDELKVYGITEVAEALCVPRVTVSVWLHRDMYDIPEPTNRLSRGAVWLAETIEPWIERRYNEMKGGKA